MLLETLVELSSWGILKNQINPLIVPEKSIHSENVGMFEMGLNCNFSFQLVLNLCLLQLFLIKHLDCYDIFRLFLSS